MADALTRDQLAEVFARARDADIEAVAGTKLFRAGRRLRGACPLCGSGEGKRSGGAFSVEPGARWFKCFACGEGGDVIDLERQLRGGSLAEAAARLAGMPAPARPLLARFLQPKNDGQAARGWLKPNHRAETIWAERRPFSGSLAETYLRARGLTPPPGLRLRFNPRCAWGWADDEGVWLCHPAMIARVVTPDGPTGGVHCTYLRPDGAGKARLDPAKRMWGPQKDAAGRPGGVWLTAPDAPGPLIVGEGIESTLAAGQLWRREHAGWPCRMVATLSLGALQGGWMLDRFGRMDPASPEPDPERPAFTWPEDPRAPWGEVLVAVDRDMSPIEVKVRGRAGGTVKRRLEAENRARICAGLAVAAWRAAGANAVRAIAPAAGRDFNDELLAGVGA